tara:strand:+ start:1291 stop:1617 length:327 start_codon:yes stop_codon:yes gene_type:complete
VRVCAMCTSSGDDEEDEDEDARLDRASASRRVDGAAIIARAPSSRPDDDDTVVVDADDARDASETPRAKPRARSNAYRRARCVDVAMAAFARAPSRSRARIGGHARQG